MDGSNEGFLFKAVNSDLTSLKSILPAFNTAEARINLPIQLIGGQHLEQLDLEGYLSGQTAFSALCLTTFRDGSLLGFSISHAIAGLYLTP